MSDGDAARRVSDGDAARRVSDGDAARRVSGEGAARRMSGGVLLPGRSWTGVVVSFDPEVGFGEAESATGDRRGFHCVTIADGSRSISVGTAVTCQVVAGATGQWELAAVAHVGGDSSTD